MLCQKLLSIAATLKRPPLMKNGAVQEAGSLRDERGWTFHGPHKTGRTGGVPDGCAVLQRDLAGWRNGLTNAKSCAWGGITPEAGQAGAAGLESSSAGRSECPDGHPEAAQGPKTKKATALLGCQQVKGGAPASQFLW